MNILIVTSEWPRHDNDISGIHVVNQVSKLREIGLNVSVFQFFGRKNPFLYIKSIFEFWKLPLEKYDLIHAHHGQSGIVALSQKKLPVVVTFHGSDLQGVFDKKGNMTLSGYVLRFVSRMVANWADEVIIVSEHLRPFVPSKKCHVIPIGIDLHVFFPMPKEEARHRLGLPLEKYLVLFVGNPERAEKRYWLANKTIESLRTKFNIELIVVNGVLHDMMPYYMNACDALLVTSLSEGSPTMVKEALACQLPIVSVDVGDVRERIETIEECVVCEDDNPETVADGLMCVLSNRKRIDGSQSVQNLDERFLIQKVIQVYQQAIEVSKAI